MNTVKNWPTCSVVVMAGGKTHLVLREEDVVKLACEFMERREMNIAQIALERSEQKCGQILLHY